MASRLLFFLLVFASFSVSAQEPIRLHYWDDKSNLSVGAEYLSNNVYLGRKDTTALPYISPRINYQTSWGGYAEVKPSYAPTKGRFDLLTIEAGYDRTGEHILYYGLNIDKYFYNPSSRSVRSETQESISGYVYYDNYVVSPSLSLMLNFGKFTDVMLDGELAHEFELMDNRFAITPTFRIQAGTQHYYSAYFGRVTGHKQTKKDREIVADANKLKLLAYELDVPLTAQIAHWTFTATPAYAIPVNPSTLTIGANTYTEHISNTFYINIDVIYHLPVGKREKERKHV